MKKRLDQHILAEEWANLAEDDLQTAKELADSDLSRQVCFHSQQAVEKYIKALLTFRQIPFKRTHDIETLAVLLKDAKALGLLRPDVIDLTEYAVEARYPGYNAAGVGKDDAKRALTAATHVSQSIKKVFNL